MLLLFYNVMRYKLLLKYFKTNLLVYLIIYYIF